MNITINFHICKHIQPPRQKAKINQIRRSLFDFTLNDSEKAFASNENKEVTQIIRIETPIQRALKHSQVARVQSKSFPMKPNQFFPSEISSKSVNKSKANTMPNSKANLRPLKIQQEKDFSRARVFREANQKEQKRQVARKALRFLNDTAVSLRPIERAVRETCSELAMEKTKCRKDLVCEETRTADNTPEGGRNNSLIYACSIQSIETSKCEFTMKLKNNMEQLNETRVKQEKSAFTTRLLVVLEQLALEPIKNQRRKN